MGSEQEARAEIDRLLAAAGWRVQDAKAANIHAALGVAIREFPLKEGHGFADYMLYVDGKAAGVLEPFLFHGPGASRNSMVTLRRTVTCMTRRTFERRCPGP